MSIKIDGGFLLRSKVRKMPNNIYSVGNCHVCSQECGGTHAKIQMWLKLHHKVAHGLKFQGMDFHKTEKVKRRHSQHVTKDDFIKVKQSAEKVKTATEMMGGVFK